MGAAQPDFFKSRRLFAACGALKGDRLIRHSTVIARTSPP
jgi:hypothetical protein